MTTLNDIGEKKFIADLLSEMPSDGRLIGGLGHDAAIISLPGSPTDLVFKIDRAAKPVAVPFGLGGYESWGRLAVTTNFSDILAVGGVPLSFALSLSLPGTFLADDARAISMGAAKACNEFGAVFSGGDTKESNEAQVVGSSVGMIKKGTVWPRRAASAGDRILILGQIGDFLAGCIHLKRFSGDTLASSIKELICNPMPRMLEAEVLRSTGLVTSATDLSDGLFEALCNVLPEGLGADLDYEKLPFSSAALNIIQTASLDPFCLSASVGDWAILATVAEDSVAGVLDLAERTGAEISAVGTIVSFPEISVERDQKRFKFNGVMNEHFRSTLEKRDGYVEHAMRHLHLLEY
ncbi:thiamine-phosphate kinase [Tateyamaria sp.]|uniref:thiamine-phosphate kinase n=1 Tax=Tateyamaria sp. TaxID=1929288 RepID=UPI00329CE281